MNEHLLRGELPRAAQWIFRHLHDGFRFLTKQFDIRLDMRISTAYYSNRSVHKSPSPGLALLKW